MGFIAVLALFHVTGSSRPKRNLPPRIVFHSKMQLFNNLGARVEIEPSNRQQNRRKMEPILGRYSNGVAKIVE